MALLTREGLLTANDLEEREVHLPALGGSVRVRSLPAAYGNEAQYEATELVSGTDRKGRAQQTVRINHRTLEALKVLHGLVDPKLTSIEDAHTFSQRCGRSWKLIVDAIDELSGLGEEAVEKTDATFPDGGPVDAGRGEGQAANGGVRAGDGQPVLPVPTGA